REGKRLRAGEDRRLAAVAVDAPDAVRVGNEEPLLEDRQAARLGKAAGEGSRLAVLEGHDRAAALVAHGDVDLPLRCGRAGGWVVQGLDRPPGPPCRRGTRRQPQDRQTYDSLHSQPPKRYQPAARARDDASLARAAGWLVYGRSGSQASSVWTTLL